MSGIVSGLSVLEQFVNGFPLWYSGNNAGLTDRDQCRQLLIFGKTEQAADAVLVKYAHDHGAQTVIPCRKTKTLACSPYIKHLPSVPFFSRK